MANPYKEAEEKRKMKAPGSPREPRQEEEVVTVPEHVQEAAEEPTGGKEAGYGSLLSEIKSERRPKKRSTTLYLSDNVLAELRKLSKKEGMSASEYLDALLKRAFGL